MIRLAGIAAVLVTVEIAAQPFTSELPIDHTHFSVFGGQPHFILNPGHRLVLEGEDAGDRIVLTITVLNQTKPITLPTLDKPRTILARVVEEREVVNGALAEVGRFWYARGIETGDVYFFGEEVDFYLDGQIIGQTQLWEAGVDGALPGIMMPHPFLLGARYYQNQAAAALDGAENAAMDVTMLTPAGSFSNCIQIRETDVLRSEDEPATKTYAPGIGLVNDDDILLLTEVSLGTLGPPSGCTFVPFSNHPYFPLSPDRRLVLEGVENGTTVIRTLTVLDETRTIPLSIGDELQDIAARVVEERRTVDGQLLEVSRGFFAQCLETGDVFHFGRETEHYQGGAVIGHEGSWLAGVSNAQAGLFMPSTLAVGARYFHQTAPGVAHDLAVNSAAGLTVTVPAGTFTRCVRITVTNLAGNNGDSRDLIHAPGIGLISDRNGLNLTSFTDPNMTNGAPILSIQDAVLLSWPFTDSPVTLQSSSDLQNWVPVPQFPAPADGGSQLAVPRDRARKYFRLEVP